METYNKDGTLASVTGTAVHPVQYVYDIENDENSVMRVFTKEIKLDGSGNPTAEWMKTYRDLLDRPYLTVYNDGVTVNENNLPRKRLSYNNLGQLASEQAPDGVVTLYGYDALGAQVYTVTDMNRANGIDFAGSDRITAMVSDVASAHSTTVNRTRTWVWDTLNQNLSNLVSLVERSVDGRRTWITTVTNGTTGPVSFREVSVLGNNVYNVTNMAPDGSFSIESYATGRLASVTRFDSGSNQVMRTSRSYDPQGRLWKITDARNGVTTYLYNSADLPTSITTPPPGSGLNAQTTVTYYGNHLRATNVVYADGTRMTNEFYPTGELKKTYGSRIYPVLYSYDAQGRMKTMTTYQNFATGAGGALTTWKYDARGFLTNKAYADGKGPDYTFDQTGKVLTRKWARGAPRIETTYTYNEAGDPWKVVYNDAITPGVTNYYDRRGRLQQVNFNGTITSNIFHFGGGILVETNIGGILGGIAVTNAYDGYLRRTAVGVYGYPATLNAYTYDTAGRLWTVSDGTNSATYTYVANSPLVGEIAFKQNTSPRMTTRKKYDFLNRLTSIVSTPTGANTPPISFDYTYNDANQRTRVNLEDGSFWVYQYDKLGQVTSGKRYWSDWTPVAGQQFEYGFDDIGNRTTTKEGGDESGSASALRASTYTLSTNLLNQYSARVVPSAVEVIGVAKPSADVKVDTESAYRRGTYFEKAKTVTNGAAAVFVSIPVTATLGGNTESSTGRVFVAKSPEGFSYDLDGNLTQDSRWTYTWDAENRLIEMVSLTSTPINSWLWMNFSYDSNGKRVQKAVRQYTNSAWNLVESTRFCYTGWTCLTEIDETGALKQRYLTGQNTYGIHNLDSGASVPFFAADSTGGGRFFATDGSDNICLVAISSSGLVGARFEYGPFQEELRSTGPLASTVTMRAAGKKTDPESKLYYFGFRYYSTHQGRWINRDPLGEHASRNRYAFVNNDRVNYTDLLGQARQDARPNAGVSLRVAPKGAKITGECGGAEARVEFKLEGAQGKNGWLVQHVTFDYRTVDCAGKPVPGHFGKSGYWEAWQVVDGELFAGDPNSPVAVVGAEDIFGNVDQGWGTKGKIIKRGTLMFMEGYELTKPPWGNNPNAGGFPPIPKV